MMMMSVVMCFTLCVPPLCQYRKSSTPFFLLNECHTIVISITVKESSALKYGRGWSFKWLPLVQYKNDKKGQQRANQRLFHLFFMEEQLWLVAMLILVLYMGKGVQLKKLPFMTMAPPKNTRSCFGTPLLNRLSVKFATEMCPQNELIMEFLGQKAPQRDQKWQKKDKRKLKGKARRGAQ